ncbi:M23 family metallopeptidase [Paenarthrobacter sp. YAF11_1]|uniref:M23 family metallopeptidase n=1 Tax=Paenarthrobacter sp. YAF11_1 TaxID=3233074 RepID=UPI003F9B1819
MVRPVDFPITQTFGENPTKDIRPGNPDYWIIELFGNYQPDGHAGFDCACPVGTPVRAVADGVVLHIGWMGGTYADNPWWIAPNFAGYCAVIDHGSFIGIYGHCKDGSGKVAKGARVREGQVFILSGNTGGSTGAHLHFEVLPDGYNLNAKFYGRVNPMPYLGSASIGPAGEITETMEEDDMPSAQDVAKALLKEPAYDGGKSVSHVLKALFEHDFVGGDSMPEGKPLKDLVQDSFSAVRTQLATIGGKLTTAPGGNVQADAAAIAKALAPDLAKALLVELSKEGN